MGDSLYLGHADLETEHVCAYCDKGIELLDEILLLQVVYPTANGGGGDEFLIIENNQGDFAYTPYYFHMHCWEEIAADVDAHNAEEEVDPMFNGRGHWECDSCTSNILPWETSGLLDEGELRRSQRQPNGKPTIHFHRTTEQRRLYCAVCLLYINESLIEMWTPFNHNGECAEGTARRCWRNGGCFQTGQCAEHGCDHVIRGE